MNEEELWEMVNNWDTKKTINCTKLRLAVSEIYKTIDTTCCQCKGNLQRSVDKVRAYLNKIEKK